VPDSIGTSATRPLISGVTSTPRSACSVPVADRLGCQSLRAAVVAVTVGGGRFCAAACCEPPSASMGFR
jgi:hypothetical protein